MVGSADVDECLDQTKNPCKGNCNNTEGNFSCTCPEGTHGDPYNKEGDGCIKDSKEFPVLKVCLGNTLKSLPGKVAYSCLEEDWAGLKHVQAQLAHLILGLIL